MVCLCNPAKGARSSGRARTLPRVPGSHGITGAAPSCAFPRRSLLCPQALLPIQLLIPGPVLSPSSCWSPAPRQTPPSQIPLTRRSPLPHRPPHPPRRAPPPLPAPRPCPRRSEPRCSPADTAARPGPAPPRPHGRGGGSGPGRPHGASGAARSAGNPEGTGERVRTSEQKLCCLKGLGQWCQVN